MFPLRAAERDLLLQRRVERGVASAQLTSLLVLVAASTAPHSWRKTEKLSLVKPDATKPYFYKSSFFSMKNYV